MEPKDETERDECANCPDGEDKGNYIFCKKYNDELYFDEKGVTKDVIHLGEDEEV